MFPFQYTRRQALYRVVFINVHDTLRDDRTAVQSLVDKVDGAPALFCAVRQRLSLSVEAGEGRQQTWMNIQDPAAKGFDKFTRQHAHVAGEANQIYLSLG